MKKIYRSTRDRKICGICGGLGEVLNVDTTLLRVLMVISIFLTSGTMIIIYLIASLIIPKDTVLDGHFTGMKGPQFNPMSNGYYGEPTYSYPPPQATPVYDKTASPGSATAASANHIDEMMKDIEKKAMANEIAELKARLAKLEKGEN